MNVCSNCQFSETARITPKDSIRYYCMKTFFEVPPGQKGCQIYAEKEKEVRTSADKKDRAVNSSQLDLGEWGNDIDLGKISESAQHQADAA